jgi:hypothetical protein
MLLTRPDRLVLDMIIWILIMAVPGVVQFGCRTGLILWGKL